MYTELNDTVVGQPLQNGIMRGAHLMIVFKSTLFVACTSVNALLSRLLPERKYQTNEAALFCIILCIYRSSTTKASVNHHSTDEIPTK